MYWSNEYKRPAYRPFKRGDWVCYAQEFYRRVARYTSPIRGRGKKQRTAHQPFQYGEVLSATELTARVAWDDGTICSVLLCNLEPAKPVIFPHRDTDNLMELLDERIRILTAIKDELGFGFGKS